MSAINQTHSAIINGITVSLSFEISKEACERLLDNPEPCDRDLLISHLQNPLGAVAIDQLHEAASKLGLNLSVQSCKFLESRQAHPPLENKEPQEVEPADDVWQISIRGENAVLARLEHGETVESYRPTDKASALKILHSLKPMRGNSLVSNEINAFQPFQMSVSQAARIVDKFSNAATCALGVVKSVDQPSAKYSDEHNASIKQKREAFEQTEIYKKAVEIEKLAEEALDLIKPTELL
ncbi:MAG: hypothetical protein U9R65_12695 [Pseudomonadota bacterium]|nr:hypothetical protein [Pseudomonadota bacterium]